MLRFDNLSHHQAFVAGRSEYHRQMQRQAAERRRRLLFLVQSGEFEPKASQALAEALGCSRMVVWRDLQALDLANSRCSHCGQLVPGAFEKALAAAAD
jgi:hypothetical protein